MVLIPNHSQGERGRINACITGKEKTGKGIQIAKNRHITGKLNKTV